MQVDHLNPHIHPQPHQTLTHQHISQLQQQQQQQQQDLQRYFQDTQHTEQDPQHLSPDPHQYPSPSHPSHNSITIVGESSLKTAAGKRRSNLTSTLQGSEDGQGGHAEPGGSLQKACAHGSSTAPGQRMPRVLFGLKQGSAVRGSESGQGRDGGTHTNYTQSPGNPMHPRGWVPSWAQSPRESDIAAEKARRLSVHALNGGLLYVDVIIRKCERGARVQREREGESL